MRAKRVRSAPCGRGDVPRDNPPPPSILPYPMGCWAGVVVIPGSCSHRAELAFVRIFANFEMRNSRLRIFARLSRVRARDARGASKLGKQR
eukprot:5213335-Prymnesium_polylepis.1